MCDPQHFYLFGSRVNIQPDNKTDKQDYHITLGFQNKLETSLTSFYTTEMCWFWEKWKKLLV